MATTVVQSGSSQIQFTYNDLSYGLLVVGIGVLTYEAVSKAVQHVATEALSKNWVIFLEAVSALAMVSAIILELPQLPKLQGQFIFVCLIYVGVSIWTRNPKTIKASSLPDYMVDMVEEARRRNYLSKIGYAEALITVEIFMNKQTIRNATLLAFPGVGKSTIPETIAYKIANEQYPPRSVFFNAKLIQVDFTDLLAGTMYRGSLEARVKEMIQLAKTDRKIIYFIDEIHTLLGAGSTIGSIVDVSQMLLPVMGRGDIRILGASTFQDYNNFIKPKEAFASRLPTAIMDEPQLPQCFQMLQHSYGQISEHGRIKISNQAIAAAILLSKHIEQRYFPRKAVDYIEYVISQAKLELDDTENDFILTERHIAKAFCSDPQTSNVDALVRTYTQFVAENPNYFPGLVEVAVNESQ